MGGLDVMAWPLQEDFNDGPISQVPKDWFETVAKILNHLTGVNCEVQKTALPGLLNPWKINISAGGDTSLAVKYLDTDGSVSDSMPRTDAIWDDVSIEYAGESSITGETHLFSTWIVLQPRFDGISEQTITICEDGTTKEMTVLGTAPTEV